jgi:signal peptidase I
VPPPAGPGHGRNGASIGRRANGLAPAEGPVISRARGLSPAVDAPTDVIARPGRALAPGMPAQRPAPGARPGIEPGRVLPRPGADEREPARPGRRHERTGARPASDFTTGKPTKKKRGRRRRGSFWRELPILLGVAVVLTVLIQTFLARVYEIPSGSMETTLHGCTGCLNDRVLVDKMTYHFGDPAPGDVVVFAGPDNWQDEDFKAQRSDNALVRGLQSIGSLVGLAPPDEKDLIKRVIAVGGQTVACCDSRNRVTVNGKPLDEPYIYYLPEAGPPTQAEFGPVRVPEGQIWVMGDSRNNSADSRVPGHGAVPIDAVIGKARYVVLPVGRMRAIPAPNPQATPTTQAQR